MNFYKEKNFNLAVALAIDQFNFGWTKEEIESYWYALGYDVFFVRELMKKFNETIDFQI